MLVISLAVRIVIFPIHIKKTDNQLSKPTNLWLTSSSFFLFIYLQVIIRVVTSKNMHIYTTAYDNHDDEDDLKANLKEVQILRKTSDFSKLFARAFFLVLFFSFMYFLISEKSG